MEWSPEAALARCFGIDGAAVVRAPIGFTNETWLVDAPGGRFAVRRSWPGKPATDREAHVLEMLAGEMVPRVVARAIDGDRVLHLFTRVEGELGPRWLERFDSAKMTSAMRALARLHARMPGWVHGDFHLGNLLWRGDEVSGVVDFDDARPGSHDDEAALALLSLARTREERWFDYDRELWEVGRAAYGRPLELRVREFCARQVRVHANAAKRGLWQLEPGIGFWPCWRTLMAP